MWFNHLVHFQSDLSWINKDRLVKFKDSGSWVYPLSCFAWKKNRSMHTWRRWEVPACDVNILFGSFESEFHEQWGILEDFPEPGENSDCCTFLDFFSPMISSSLLFLEGYLLNDYLITSSTLWLGAVIMWVVCVSFQKTHLQLSSTRYIWDVLLCSCVLQICCHHSWEWHLALMEVMPSSLPGLASQFCSLTWKIEWVQIMPNFVYTSNIGFLKQQLATPRMLI